MDIKFTKSEAYALRNITNILITYLNTQYETIRTQQQANTARMFIDLHDALDAGETEFGFSRNCSYVLINAINFWYEGVGRTVLNSDKLQGNARKVFTKHYKLTQGIIKKLEAAAPPDYLNDAIADYEKSKNK
jgi:hypothetical protein